MLLENAKNHEKIEQNNTVYQKHMHKMEQNKGLSQALCFRNCCLFSCYLFVLQGLSQNPPLLDSHPIECSAHLKSGTQPNNLNNGSNIIKPWAKAHGFIIFEPLFNKIYQTLSNILSNSRDLPTSGAWLLSGSCGTPRWIRGSLGFDSPSTGWHSVQHIPIKPNINMVNHGKI